MLSKTSGNRSSGHPATVEHRQAQHVYGPLSSPRNLPPTPPLHPNSTFDGSHQSPTTTSSHSSTSIQHFASSAINNIDPQQQQQQHTATSSTDSYSSRHLSQSPFTSPIYNPSTSGRANYSATSQAPSQYYQRPLPPPEPSHVSHASGSNIGGGSPVDHSNPWQQQHQQHQHHHYISPSAAAAFANQQTERYICQTCSKAFSRPSSLRIHSHSHTGEKPFKCPHSGCGKAFSVRSNMKRHERGCHGNGSLGSI